MAYNQGGYPPEEEYPQGGDFPAEGGYSNWQHGGEDQYQDPNDPRSPEPVGPGYSLPPSYGDGEIGELYTEAEENYTTANLHNFPTAVAQQPNLTSFKEAAKSKGKGKVQSKGGGGGHHTDHGHGKDKKKGADKRGTDKKGVEKKGSDKKSSDKKDSDKKGKKAATAEDLELDNMESPGQDFEEHNEGFGGPATAMNNAFGIETYGLSSSEAFDPNATLAQTLASLNMDPQIPQSNYAGPSGSGVYDVPVNDTLNEVQFDDPVMNVESQYGSKPYSNTESSHPIGDNLCRVHHSRDWKFGHMLIMWWTEPKGAKAAKGSMWSKQHSPDNTYWEGWRRFLIVSKKNDGGNSKCVPITTYQGQGLKLKAKPQHHGIVHDSRNAAVRATTEPDLGFAPIAVDMLTQHNTLHPMSRINYNKIHSLEHHYECCFLGRVSKKDEAKFKEYAKIAFDV